MKFISWNVNGLRAVAKRNDLDQIFKQKPDIVALQETKCTLEQLPKDALAPEGYIPFFDSAKERKGYSGVAIYTKITPKKIEFGLGDKEYDHEGRMITLYFDDFVFVNCYFPNGGRDAEHFKFKLRFYDKFLEKMVQLKKKHHTIIFAGDLNVAHNEIDIARPKENQNQIGFLPIERAWVDRVEKAGFTDVFRYKHPKEVKYSWWDQKSRARDRNVGWRIDYFFINKENEKRIKKAEILNEIYGSDHCPITLEIK